MTQGIDSLGEVTIRISDNLGQIFSGRGSDADIVVSSAKAYVNAINRMITIREESSNSTIENSTKNNSLLKKNLLFING